MLTSFISFRVSVFLINSSLLPHPAVSIHLVYIRLCIFRNTESIIARQLRTRLGSNTLAISDRYIDPMIYRVFAKTSVSLSWVLSRVELKILFVVLLGQSRRKGAYDVRYLCVNFESFFVL